MRCTINKENCQKSGNVTAGSTGHANAGESVETEGESEEDSSNHHIVEEALRSLDIDADDELLTSNEPSAAVLEDFRQKWLVEIGKKGKMPKHEFKRHLQHPATNAPTAGGGLPSSSSPLLSVNPNQDALQLAKQIYMHGLQAERSGRLVLAVQFYRQATQLVPDIDLHCQAESRSNSSASSTTTTPSAFLEDYGKDSMKLDDATSHTLHSFQDFSAEIFAAMHETATPPSSSSNEVPTPPSKVAPILTLPSDVLMRIFRWVVGTSLDIRQLENLSQVCRRFYLLSRDPSLWRSICRQRWSDSGVVRLEGSPFQSWRHMALYRPHVLHHGCYIARASYVRQGEPTVGQVYNPYYMVEYFRVIRFTAHRCVFMLTATADSPLVLVKQISQLHENGDNANTCSLPGLLVGHYRVVDDVVSCVLRKAKVEDHSDNDFPYSRRNRRTSMLSRQQETADYTYYLDLGIKSAKKRLHCKLTWYNYNLNALYRVSDRLNVTNFDVMNNPQYPPFLFSRVKSYTTNVSDEPLPDL